ncbi:MAG: hypothetical protein B7Y26_08445 [Hydrogenophilales bacterium 16-64-46]|nr:MAG: hypothetical protein B7Z32_03800 [Hydrogenophilales bacterium 12-64-13]OYZ05297.1 MAG: hypothetical protein B7Y26_08445 [Hydrogenophilales bacterium 16-64-46]OZA37111.1 MAG: hypothetical protein B7X87_12490 [Hydrogenophilales bacterium 17-64-34]HQS99407.1 PAS domain S-box protein [Thiobacillus sp.]
MNAPHLLSRIPEHAIRWAAGLGLLLVFATDFFTLLGFAHGFLYLPVLLLAMFQSRRGFIRAITVLAIAGTWVGLATSPPPPTGFPFGYVVGNRAGASLALLAVYLVYRQYFGLVLRERLAHENERARQLNFEALAESLPLHVWTATPAGVVDFAGSRIETITGVSRAEALANWLDLLHPDDRAPTVERWQHSVASGEPYEVEFRLRTPDGGYVWHLARAVPERDADGRVTRWFGSSIDIEHLRQLRSQTEDLAERLQETVESITDAFFTLDTDYRVTYVNARAAALLGQTQATMRGRKIWDSCGLDEHCPFVDRYRQVLASQTPAQFQDWFAPRGRWLDVRIYPSARGLAVYFQDITRAREERQELLLLRSAVSRLNDIVLITEAGAQPTADDPKIVYVNDAFTRLTGYDREEAIGSTPRLLQGPRTQRDELDRIRAALERWQPVRAELINYTKAGEAFWLELDIVPLADDDGRYTHWVAIARDISERKRTLETLRVSDERFQLVTLATNDVIWDWDLVQDTLWWNAGLLTRFGYPPSSVEPGPESWIKRIHADDRERVLAGIHAAIDGNATDWSDEYRFLHADGRAAIVVDRGFIIRDDAGRAVRMVGSMLDLSERRELEERLRQSQKLEAVGQLTGGVAHDFNNLLTVILGNAELLGEQVAGQPALRRLADMTMTAASRGAELTHRLLAFARRQALEPQAVDLNRLVAGIDAMLRRTLAADIDLEITRAGGLWLADVDPGQLEVALLNLTINARDAMPGGGSLTIETANATLDDSYADAHQEVTPGQYVLVSVSDTGTGMTPEIAARAIEPFFTTKDVGKGSGLGLSMVYGFVKQSRGHIKLYSEPGHGTTVKLYFPRAAASQAGAPPPPAPRAAGGSEHILVVEDNALVRTSLVGQLEGLGYRVTAAENGPQALALIQATADFDLLFTDVVMPGGMSGRVLADAARAARPGLKVLFTSGYTENAIVHHGRLDRGVHLLSKPYRRQDMAAKVRRVLDEAVAGPPPQA